ncbi:hypothetical protein HK096_007346, partial [Nowakowskiella sp. JEL0078]
MAKSKRSASDSKSIVRRSTRRKSSSVSDTSSPASKLPAKLKPTISVEEVALYDRQIRLWGLDAQARMRDSKILLINVDALNTEILKNLVLAGIGKITILDHRSVEESDLGAQFFISKSELSSN